MAAGFLQEVIKGWYIPSRPDEIKAASTAWYALFWRFCAFIPSRAVRRVTGVFRPNNPCVCTRVRTVPHQLMVRSARARNKTTKPRHRHVVVRRCAALPAAADRAEKSTGPCASFLVANPR